MDNCVARSNSQTAYSLISSSTCSILNCKAISTGFQNQDDSSEESFVYGFVSSNGHGNIFKNCIANATQNIPSTNYNAIIAGFGLRNNEQCSSILSCQADHTISGTSGFTIPTGILLEGTFDSTTSLTNRGNVSINSSDWSPDGRYITTTGSTTIEILSYDYENDELAFIASESSFSLAQVVRWSHDGKYLLTATLSGIRIYSFDPIRKSLTFLTSAASGIVYGIAWSPDDRFVLASGAITSPTTDKLQIFAFDKATNNLTHIASALPPAVVRSEAADWHPKNNLLLAVTAGLTSSMLYLYKLDAANATLQLISSISEVRSRSIKWSPDGNYLVTCTVGGGFGVSIYKFDSDAASNPLTLVGTLSIGGGGQNVQWSPDSKYILCNASSGASTPGCGVYRVNRLDSGTVSFSLISQITTASTVRGGCFSPDGSRIAVTS